MESSSGTPSRTTQRVQDGWIIRATVWCMNNNQNLPSSNLQLQWGVPLAHRGKLGCSSGLVSIPHLPDASPPGQLQSMKVQPLSRGLIAEPTQSVEVSLTISSWFCLTSHINSGATVSLFWARGPPLTGVAPSGSWNRCLSDSSPETDHMIYICIYVCIHIYYLDIFFLYKVWQAYGPCKIWLTSQC